MRQDTDLTRAFANPIELDELAFASRERLVYERYVFWRRRRAPRSWQPAKRHSGLGQHRWWRRLLPAGDGGGRLQRRPQGLQQRLARGRFPAQVAVRVALDVERGREMQAALRSRAADIEQAAQLGIVLVGSQRAQVRVDRIAFDLVARAHRREQ